MTNRPFRALFQVYIHGGKIHLLSPTVLLGKATPTVREAVTCVRERSHETIASSAIQTAINNKLKRSVISLPIIFSLQL